ncbi:MAG: Hsp20/alpha crystallin family protein [Flavobacterium sp.]|nr:Hsp20/alpha crystallin family protein [Flavobacterium sp.]
MNLVKRQSVPLASVIDELFKPDWFGGFQDFEKNVPLVNIQEAETNFLIELAVPEMKKKDFNIEIDSNVLTISSVILNENEEINFNGRYTRKEFNFSSFKRSFTLSNTVNTEKINALYENGVLAITLPKKEEALPKPKRLIEIN